MTPQDSIHRFFYHLDGRNTAGLLATLAEDAVWFRQGKRHAGVGAIERALATRSTTLFVRHAITNLFELDAAETEASDDVLRAHDPEWRRGQQVSRVFSYYLTGYTHDDGTPREAPCDDGHLHKLSWVRTRLVQRNERWLIAEKYMLAQFVFHGV